MTKRKKEEPLEERARCLNGVTELRPLADDAAEAFPDFFDVMMPRYKDGICTRKPGRLTLVAEGNLWKITLDCPTEELMTVVYLSTLVDLATQLERAIHSPGCVWTPDWNAKKKERTRQRRGG